MVRKGALAGAAYFIGLFLAAYGSAFIKVGLIAVMILSGVCVKFGKYAKPLCFCAVFFLAGIGYNILYTQTVCNKITAMEGKDIAVKGYVTDYGFYDSERCLVTVKGRLNGVKGQVSFLADAGDYDYYSEIEGSFKGEKLRDNMNFSSKSYNRSKGVFIDGGEGKITRVGRCKNPLFRKILHLRDDAVGTLDVCCSGRSSAFLQAMLCGEKSELTGVDKGCAYRSGIGHLLAVSGTHLIIVSEIILIFLGTIKSKRLKFMILMFFVWSFAVFSGLSVSVIRAAVMMSISKSAFVFGRKGDAGNSLGIAAIILTAENPYAVCSASFLLTFAASVTMGIIVPAFTKRIKQKGIVGKLLMTVLSYEIIMITLLPLNMLLFGGVSVISPVSNLLIPPFFTAGMLLGMIYLIFGFFGIPLDFVIKAAGFFTEIGIKLSEKISNIPHSYICSRFLFLDFIMIVCCIGWLWYVWKHKSILKSIAMILSMAVCWNAVYLVMERCFAIDEICVLPAGKSCVYILNHNGKCFVFDCNTKGKNNGSVSRYIERFGVDEVDGMFITEGVYTQNKAENYFSILPDKIFTDTVLDNSDDTVLFYEGAEYKEEDIYVYRKSNGYLVQADNENILLTPKGFLFMNNSYFTDKTDSPVKINLKTKTVRRSDNGFN